MSATLLTIVARGSAIITELTRLVELIPSPFVNGPHGFSRDDNKSVTDALTCDFSYFRIADSFEARIESSDALKRADEEFCDNYIETLTRFYLTFESVYRYADDLNSFIDELEDEALVGQTLDGLMEDIQGRQLLCEAFFLLGYMLMTVDNNFEGGLRERLIVSFYRYSSYKSSPNSSVDETCNLMRSTGFRSSYQQTFKGSHPVNYYRPDNYPESFFSRVSVNKNIVNLIIARMQSTDIYNQTKTTFPHPDHRSAALSQQASMVYVMLYFCPNILISQKSRMREITDKFFPGSWIISVYTGELVNLIKAWEPYKAASESLIQLFEVETSTVLIEETSVKFSQLFRQLQESLKEGWLTSEIALTHHAKILNLIRDSNVTLKWIIIHSRWQDSWNSKLSKTLHNLVTKKQPDGKSIYMFLQSLAELEKLYFARCDHLLTTRQEGISEQKQRASNMLYDLIDIFQGTKPMRWIDSGKNSKLACLLENTCRDLESIDFTERRDARSSVVKLVGDIESIRESYSDGKSLQVVQLFSCVKECLLMIVKLLDLDENIKVVLQSVGEFSYAWRIMDQSFTSHMQQVIKDDPMKVYGIESIFMKLNVSFETLLIRIQQIDSKADLISVSQYYSTKLVAYIRDVLQVIPATILELVSQVVAIQTDNVMSDMPAKISLDSLKDYALPEKRFHMLELTYQISHYAESLLLMQNTTIGLIRINSKQLLEDGIRRELVRSMSDAIQQILKFPRSSQSHNIELKVAATNLLAKLEQLGSVMSGYKRSFEYIQDYLSIYGLRTWQEELSRIVKFNAEIVILELDRSRGEADQSAMDEQASLYQSTRAPIPTYGVDGLQSSFIARTLDELLRITDPRATIYDEQMSAWYEQKPSRERVIDLKVFELIGFNLSAAGLNGFDQVCCAMIMSELVKLDAHLISLAMDTSTSSQTLRESLESLRNLRSRMVEHSRQQSQRILSSASAKMAPHSDTIVNYLLRIGQLQAIRINISCVISTKCRYEAKNLYSCLETMNESLLVAIKRGKAHRARGTKSSSQHKGISDSNEPDDSQPSAAVKHERAEVSRDYSDINDDPETPLEDSQLIFELTNHLEWVGLSDPMSKIYTLALLAAENSKVTEFRQQLVAVDLMFLIVLNQCSRFHFSPSICGFLPKQSRSFYDSNCTVDGQPLFYGLVTLLNHYQPLLDRQGRGGHAAAGECSPISRLLKLMSLHVKCFVEQPNLGAPVKPQEFTLEVENMILSIVELLRVSRLPASDVGLDNTYLPKFIAETFQFTLCNFVTPLGSNINKS